MCVWCSPHVMFLLLKYSNCSHVGVDEIESGRTDRTYKLYPQKEYHLSVWEYHLCGGSSNAANSNGINSAKVNKHQQRHQHQLQYKHPYAKYGLFAFAHLTMLLQMWSLSKTQSIKCQHSECVTKYLNNNFLMFASIDNPLLHLHLNWDLKIIRSPYFNGETSTGTLTQYHPIIVINRKKEELFLFICVPFLSHSLSLPLTRCVCVFVSLSITQSLPLLNTAVFFVSHLLY